MYLAFTNAKSLHPPVKNGNAFNLTDTRRIFEKVSSFGEEIYDWDTTKSTSLCRRN